MTIPLFYDIIYIENKKGCVNMKKVLDNIFVGVGVILIIWIVASFINIGLHNDPFDDDYKNYWEYNFFVLAFPEGE